MATKSANVLARVELEATKQAEEILSKLGIPASVVVQYASQTNYYDKEYSFSVTLRVYGEIPPPII